MELLFTETLDKHFYTNDRENRIKKGHTEALHFETVILEDTVSYLIKKYNFNIQ